MAAFLRLQNQYRWRLHACWVSIRGKMSLLVGIALACHPEAAAAEGPAFRSPAAVHKQVPRCAPFQPWHLCKSSATSSGLERGCARDDKGGQRTACQQGQIKACLAEPRLCIRVNAGR